MTLVLTAIPLTRAARLAGMKVPLAMTMRSHARVVRLHGLAAEAQEVLLPGLALSHLADRAVRLPGRAVDNRATVKTLALAAQHLGPHEEVMEEARLHGSPTAMAMAIRDTAIKATAVMIMANRDTTTMALVAKATATRATDTRTIIRVIAVKAMVARTAMLHHHHPPQLMMFRLRLRRLHLLKRANVALT